MSSTLYDVILMLLMFKILGKLEGEYRNNDLERIAKRLDADFQKFQEAELIKVALTDGKNKRHIAVCRHGWVTDLFLHESDLDKNYLVVSAPLKGTIIKIDLTVKGTFYDE